MLISFGSSSATHQIASTQVNDALRMSLLTPSMNLQLFHPATTDQSYWPTQMWLTEVSPVWTLFQKSFRLSILLKKKTWHWFRGGAPPAVPGTWLAPLCIFITLLIRFWREWTRSWAAKVKVCWWIFPTLGTSTFHPDGIYLSIVLLPPSR